MNLPNAQKLMVELDKKMMKMYYDETDLLNPPLLVQNNSPANHIYSGPKTKTQKIQEVKELFDKIPEFVVEPQPLKYLGDKEKTIGYPKGGDAIAKQQEAYQKKKVIGMWHDQMKESNKFQAQLKKKIIGSGAKKLMKANNEIVTKEYHVYASHPSELKDCKACRVILNFFKWQKKSIAPPKDTYASPKWTTFSGQPTTLLVDDPLIGPPKQPHAITCTCKNCPIKPEFVAKKGEPFSHVKKTYWGLPITISNTKLKKYEQKEICTTSYGMQYPPIATICDCGETIIKWE